MSPYVKDVAQNAGSASNAARPVNCPTAVVSLAIVPTTNQPDCKRPNCTMAGDVIPADRLPAIRGL